MLFVIKQTPHEPVKCINFKSKRNIPKIAQNRHLKNLEKTNVGNVILPFHKGREIIPELPEESHNDPSRKPFLYLYVTLGTKRTKYKVVTSFP